MTRVAAYCRVSTDKTDQIHSFNSQKAFFNRYIADRPDWSLTEIYADEGITGTTTADRSGFLRMIEDATHGKFDIIITKEVSRFSRNLLDAIAFTRHLKRLGVGVIFLNDGISTLETDAELRLGIMASVAQEESRRTSERVRWGQLRQMERGVVFGRSLLGYDVKNGNISIEPDGAATVRQIFSMYLNDRLGVRAIAKALNALQIPTRSGSATWSGATVLKIIRNEKYCGDLVQKKTVTTDYLTHKKMKNSENERICIYGHHEPIIGRERWEAAQAELKHRSHVPKKTEAYGNRYALSGKIRCAGCKALYICRTRHRKDGSGYRVWTCPKCICRQRNAGQIRDDALAHIVRHIVSLHGGNVLIEGLDGIMTKIMNDHESDFKVYSKEIARTERKKAMLIDTYIAGDISREEYISRKAQYETELERLGGIMLHLQASESVSFIEETLQTSTSMSAGEDEDDGFYLSLVDRIDVVNNAVIDIVLLKLAGKWTIEF